jgi:Zn-finger nucleic acid-binding protein
MYRSGPRPAGTCPRCGETLLAVADVPGVRWCDRCGGVLADTAATRRIITRLDRTLLEIGFQAALGKARTPDAERRSVACPECLLDMQKLHIASAACDVDLCPLHGTWFDTGELEDVMRAYAHARRVGLSAHLATPSAPSETERDRAELVRALVGDRMAP